MTDAARAELLARLKARYGGGRSNELPIPPPAELREHLADTIPHTLTAEPERIPDSASHKETVNQYLRKGMPDLVEGRVTIRELENKNGEMRSATEVVVSDTRVLGSKGRRFYRQRGQRPKKHSRTYPSSLAVDAKKGKP